MNAAMSKNIRLENGDLVPTTTQAKYLGSMVSWNMPFRTAFKHGCALAEEADKKTTVGME